MRQDFDNRYWRTGQAEQAVEMWTEAIDLAEADLADLADLLDEDTRRVVRMAPKKIRAAQEGAEPPVAALGKGVSEPKKKRHKRP